MSSTVPSIYASFLEFVVENLARSLSDSGYISFSLLDKIEE